MRKLMKLLLGILLFPLLGIQTLAAELVYQSGSFCNVPAVDDQLGRSSVYTSLGEEIVGVSVDHQKNQMVFDQFSLSKDTFVQYVEFFVFTEGSSTESGIKEGFYSIYRGSPTEGNVNLILESTTSAMTNTYFTGCYRVLEDDLASVSRPIMAVQLSVFSMLEQGDYWIGFSATSNVGFDSPQTISVTTEEGVRAGSMLQLSDGNYSAVIDGTENTQLRLPFIMIGSDPIHPDVPPVEIKEVTDSSVSLVETEGYEYQVNFGEWVESGVFLNLRSNTEYSFSQRKKEKDGYLASNPSEAVVVRTLKVPQSTPSAPSIVRTTATTIELLETRGFEYRIDQNQWQPSGVFRNLLPNTRYVFEQRKAETEVYAPSAMSESTEVVTRKFSANTPVSPAVLTVSYNQIELVEVEGYEYRIHEQEWQDSPIFANLNPKHSYTFYQRIKESSTTYASESSMGVEVTTLRLPDEKPVAPVVRLINERSFELDVNDELEYSLDGSTWTSNPSFDGLASGREYQVYYRFADTKTQGDPITVLTKNELTPIEKDPQGNVLWFLLGGLLVIAWGVGYKLRLDKKKK